MTGSVIRFTVQDHVPGDDVKDALNLALVAAEGLFGSAAIRTEVNCEVGGQVVTIGTESEPGRAVARLMAQFLGREFGERSFRIASVTPERNTVAAEPLGAA